jgi:hypothetical protein
MFFFFFVWLVVTYNFAVCDLSVLWYVFEFNEEACVCSWNVVDALEEATRLIAKAYFPKRLEVWILHEVHVIHFIARHWVYYCVGKMFV